MTNMAPVKDPQKEYMDRITSVLGSLSQTPGWEMYVDIIADIRTRKIAELLQDTKENFDLNRGLIAGLNLLLAVPGLYKNHTNSN